VLDADACDRIVYHPPVVSQERLALRIVHFVLGFVRASLVAGLSDGVKTTVRWDEASNSWAGSKS
jgi:hypothetical protein